MKIDPNIKNDPIWITPIKTQTIRRYMGAIRDFHLEKRDEGNRIWKEQIDAENPDVDVLIELRETLEAHGIYAQLASRLCVQYDAAVFKARHPEAPE